MDFRKCLPPLVLCALLLAACTVDVQGLLAEDASRAEAIRTLVADASMRDELFDALLGGEDARSALFDRIVDDDENAGLLIERLMRSDRTRAVAAARIASDYESARTFIGMMMLSGAAGEVLSRDQAECLELGDALTHGNQRKTMTDLKRLGGVVDGWAREAGAYPVCREFQDVSKCLAANLPQNALADLRLRDAWGRPFLYYSDADGGSYALISFADDGEYDGLGKAGPTSSVNADIVFSDGQFVQWPANIRQERIQ
jgi:hypothetical protein